MTAETAGAAADPAADREATAPAPALALDIGGSTMSAALVDERGTITARGDIATPKDGARRTFDALREVIEGLRAPLEELSGVGIACAGPLELSTGSVSPINIRQWRGFPLRTAVAELVPHTRVALANDGLCMALGEYWLGAGRGHPDMLGLVVSTGVGGGLILGGQGYLGRSGNAGHVGHMVVEPEGDRCTCGGRGCVETVASGPAMVRWARVRGWQAPPHAHTAHLAAAARMGEEIALAAFRRGGRAIALAIAATAALCDLDLVVLGGGVAQSGGLLLDPVRTTLAEHAGLSFLAGLRVVPCELPAEAGLLGAAALVGHRTDARPGQPAHLPRRR
ncbi:MAG: ROK family protein [Sciscionella sp.]